MKRIGIVLKWQVNSLARLFYAMQGYNVEKGHDFSQARHPAERLCWRMALDSYEFWQGSKQAPEEKK